jgi:hypothetical protein
LAEAQARIDQLQSRLQQLEQAQLALDHLQKLLPQLADSQAKPAQTEARTQPPVTSVALTEATAILTPVFSPCYFPSLFPLLHSTTVKRSLPLFTPFAT